MGVKSPTARVQALGNACFVAAILAGNSKTLLSVLSFSLGQVACSRVLGLLLGLYDLPELIVIYDLI
jgi:uncharacterized protein YpmS